MTSSAVETINNMRSRPTALSVRLTKANLLALTVVVTSFPDSFNLSRAVLEEFTYLISHKMTTDDGEVSVTASTCARSILLASGRTNAPIRYCAGQLLAGLVGGVAQKADKLHNKDDLAIVGEEIRALVGLFSTLPPTAHAPLMCAVVPTLLLLLSEDDDGSAPHQLAVSQLVSLASNQSAAFKVAAASLDETRRSFLERSVRKALQGGAAPGSRAAAKPKTVALRSFGS